MILSASRRTDIPSYYSDWFFNRIKAGFFYVRNPMNARQISRTSLSPDIVDCIVFWTKNPKNMIDQLDELKDYMYYFQFTITGYGRDVEPGIPDKKREIIPSFIRLSEMIGKKRVIWRYDPILISDKYTKKYHLHAFEEIAKELCAYTEKVIISFVDLYVKTKRNAAGLNIHDMTNEDMTETAEGIVSIAQKYRLTVESCAEQIDLDKLGIRHGSCINKELIEELTGCRLIVSADNQRANCGCVESVDMGTYDTCRNGCKYCYATINAKTVKNRAGLYDPLSPLLCGTVWEDDKITERKVKSLRDTQISFFD